MSSYNLRNIGPVTEEWLRRAGINTREEVIQLGPEAVYEQLVAAGHPSNKNLLWALIGAVENLDWRTVAEIHKENRNISSG